jgi:glycosyltransferase involved in cell wall biosynthesis
MKRIALLTAKFPYGRTETFFLPEIESLINEHNCDVIIIPQRPDNCIFHENLKVLKKYTVKKPLLSLRYFGSILLALVIKPKLLFRSIFLILGSKNIKTILLNGLIFPKSIWISNYVSSQKIDHIHAYWSSTTATMAMITSEMTGCTWSFTGHSYDIRTNNLLNEKIKRSILARFISEKARDFGCKYAGVSKDQAKVIHLGIKLVEQKHIKKRKNQEKFVLLCPASLHKVKGHQYLIEAMFHIVKSYPFVHLMLAGEGIERVNIENQISRLGLSENITMLGVINQKTLLAMYENSEVDAVVLPSIDLGGNEHEGIPVSLMEAMSNSIPVISTNTGGIPELLHDGAGIIVEEKNSESICTALRQLLIEDDLYESLARNGFERVKKEYNATITSKMILDSILFHTDKTMRGDYQANG